MTIYLTYSLILGQQRKSSMQVTRMGLSSLQDSNVSDEYQENLGDKKTARLVIFTYIDNNVKSTKDSVIGDKKLAAFSNCILVSLLCWYLVM